MNATAAYIAGDWGTSYLRLFLCSDGQVLESRTGPGVAQLAPDPAAFSRTVAELTGPWICAYGPLPIRLSGMVGARTGWREAPYVPCPTDAAAVAASMLRFDVNGQEIAISPGVSCVNPYGAPDVMRGEETQVFGALAQSPAPGRRIFVLPGTHAKWVLVEDGRILGFQTSLSGELYGLLRDHSTLTRASSAAATNADTSFDLAAFDRGTQRARELHTAPLHHLLFETRSRQLIEAVPAHEALAFLSGLIIGQDVAGARRLLGELFDSCSRISLIGSAPLTQLYQHALKAHDVEATIIDASDATLSGLQTYAALAQCKEATRALTS